MNKIKLKLFRCFLLTLFVAFATTQTYAQETMTVKGKVVDDSNEPLIGVSVGVSGTAGGTRTDVNGNFQLAVPATAKTLKFSYIGFDSKTVAVSATMDVKMATSTNTLEDVVVTGYQTQKKKDVTGAVSNISSKDFNQGNVTNSILQIQGKVSGLSIVQSSGDPNSQPTIRLRGQTSLFGSQSPLLIVDGVQLDGIGQLSNIPPGDIATYDVLKDASATSIYGSRGANGVIIITTKRGVAGTPKVEYQGFAAVDNQAKYRDLLTGDDWRAQNPGKGLPFNVGNTNTDWQRAITRQAYTQSHTVGISGGNKGFTYRGSANYLKQDNIIINSDKEQMGIRFNAEQKALNDKLNLQLGISNTITNRKYVNINSLSVNQLSPGIPVYDSLGNYNSFQVGQGNLRNIVQIQNTVLNTGKQNFTQYFGSAKYEILPGLKAGVVGSISTFNENGRYFRPKYALAGNTAKKTTYTNESYRGEINASYDRSWGKHNFSALSVYEYNYFTNNGFGAAADSIPYEFFADDALQASLTSKKRIESSRAENKLISVLGRFNYNYNNKYYASVGLRRDGSSKLGKKWGTFPAATVAWRITQENFMKDILWVNDLKLRVGYGETGNQDAISEYGALRLRRVEGNVDRNGNTNITKPNETINYTLAQNENPFLQWEVRQGRNIGLDFAFFNSRLSGDINYFNDITKKMLFTYESSQALPLPYTPENRRPSGQYVTANVGDMTNKGLELALNFRAVEKKDFSWTVGGQISGVRTRIVRLQDDAGIYKLKLGKVLSGTGNFLQSAGPLTYLVEGQVPFVFELPKYLGIDSTGQQMVDTVKNFIDPSPRFNYGINNSFTYKNWGLNFFVRGVSGVKIYNNNSSNVETNYENGFSANGYNTTYAALNNGLGLADNVVSDRWLENGSFLRLDNISLSYNFTKFKQFQNLRVSLSANNVFVITKFTGLDPEVENAGGISSDNNSSTNYLNNEEGVPRTRSFSFGLSASF